MQAYGFVTQLGYVVFLFDMPSYALYVGMTAQQGSVLTALLCLGNFFGRVSMGTLSDRFGSIMVTFVATFFSGLWTLTIWPFTTSYGARLACSASFESMSKHPLTMRQVSIFFCLFAGLTVGVYWATIAPICAEVVGLKDLNAALSISFFNVVLPLTFSEAIALEIVKHTDSYLGAQLFTGFMYIAGALLLWFLKTLKVGELERVAESIQDNSNTRSLAITRSCGDDQKDVETQEKPKSSYRKRFLALKMV